MNGFGVNSGLERGSVPAVTRDSIIALVALAAVDSAGGIASWQNPTGAAIIIDEIQIDVTTPSSGALTIDAGATSANGTTLSDNLIDGVDGHTAAKLFTSRMAADQGSNGKACQHLAAGKWVTFSTASGAAAGLAGNAYIHYHLA